MMVGVMVFGMPGVVVLQTNYAPDHPNRASQRSKQFMSFAKTDAGVQGNVALCVRASAGVGSLLRTQLREHLQSTGEWEDEGEEDSDEEEPEAVQRYYQENTRAARVLQDGRGLALATQEEICALMTRNGCGSQWEAAMRTG